LKYYLTVIIPGIQLLLLAPILIIVILAFPSGIVGFIKKVFKSNKVKRLVI
jgi:branched-chain amino acid transport system permease protein